SDPLLEGRRLLLLCLQLLGRLVGGGSPLAGGQRRRRQQSQSRNNHSVHVTPPSTPSVDSHRHPSTVQGRYHDGQAENASQISNLKDLPWRRLGGTVLLRDAASAISWLLSPRTLQERARAARQVTSVVQAVTSWTQGGRARVWTAAPR